ncbi:MAG: PIN domain-containing protein [Actinobacteria bacterium]|nr:PIN domain-containing protein [Actinomycetota bacterium]
MGQKAEEIKIRAFLDSNVIFSGLRSDDGPPGAVIERAAGGGFSPVVSRQVLEEVVRVVAAKLPDGLPSLHALLLNMPLEVCEDPDPEAVAAWVRIVGKDDAPIAAAASAAEVDCLVSGDGHFLKARDAAAKKGLRIVSPSEFH